MVIMQNFSMKSSAMMVTMMSLAVYFPVKMVTTV